MTASALLSGALAFLLVGVVFAWLGEVKQRRALLRWLESSAPSELPDGQGRWRAIFASLERAQRTQQRESADVLRRLQRYFTAAQVMPDGIIVLDDADRIEWLNQAATVHLGIDLDRDRGTLISQLIRKPAFYEYLAAFHAGDDIQADGVQFVVADDMRTLSLHLLRFSDHGILLLSRDISAIVRTEKMRRDFVANVSHELRTPATVITGFLEQLNGDDPPSDVDAKRFLAMMAQQAERMRRLIEDLLTLSRLESDNRVVREGSVDVAAMIDGLVSEARALSGGRHTIELGEISGECLNGNVDELRSAFGNLLSNAVRYTPEQGTITIDWTIAKGDPVFSVRDTGIGIAAEHLPRLTERFYRVDRGRSSATGGTGLGLAIVKHVLSRHEGKLQIKSTPGGGSTFIAHFPVARLVQQTPPN